MGLKLLLPLQLLLAIGVRYKMAECSVRSYMGSEKSWPPHHLIAMFGGLPNNWYRLLNTPVCSFFKDFCCKEKERSGVVFGGKNGVREGYVFFFKELVRVLTGVIP